MSIADEFLRINGSKSDIARAIERKGVTVPPEYKIDRYSELVDLIISEGGIPPSDGKTRLYITIPDHYRKSITLNFTRSGAGETLVYKGDGSPPDSFLGEGAVAAPIEYNEPGDYCITFEETMGGKIYFGGASPSFSVITGADSSYQGILNRAVLGSAIDAIQGYSFYGQTSLRHISVQPNLVILGEYAFYGCTSLQSVDLSNTGITAMGAYCFRNCSSLRSVNLPAGLVHAGASAFRSCISLGLIELPEGFLSTPNYLCNSCSTLQCVIIPSTVVSLSSSSFTECPSIKEYLFYPVSPPDGSLSVPDAAKIYVPDDSVSAYRHRDSGFHDIRSQIYPLSERVVV